MGANSKIEWCDHTFNPWRGCTKVSPGCANCYAEALSRRNPKLLGVWGPGQPRVRASKQMWREPLTWNEDKICDTCGREVIRGNLDAMCNGGAIFGCLGTLRRPRVFCASLADWLDAEVPVEWLADLLDLVRRTPNLDWLLLTKRPENWLDRVTLAIGSDLRTEERGKEFNDWLTRWSNGHAPENVWLGTSVEDQRRADERIPVLLSIPARVRFLSCEPLLESVDLANLQVSDVSLALGEEWDRLGMDRNPFRLQRGRLNCTTRQIWPQGVEEKGWLGGVPSIHWVIVGGESGPRARPMEPQWARGLRDQCQTSGTPFFFKQWGAWGPNKAWDQSWIKHKAGPRGARHICANYEWIHRLGKENNGRLFDGAEHNGVPATH